MDIYNYLKKDHQKVAELMEQVVESESPSKREKLFNLIKLELSLHADTEEATFYKAIEKATQNSTIEKEMNHAHGEHDEIRDCLEKLESLSPDQAKWMTVFKDLKEAVTHHVEEEENEIFTDAKKLLSSAQANDLAREMDMLKKKQLSQMEAA